MRRLIIFIISLIFVFGLATLLVAYGRGYRLNFEEKKIAGTGILSVSSTPEGAELYLNNDLKGGTDTSIPNLTPGKYTVKLEKDGFNSWEKEIEIEKEKVTPLEVILFPSAPDLSALTFSGVSKAVLSPNGVKIAYSVTKKEKAGIWVLELTNRQFFFSSSPRQITQDSNSFKFSTAEFEWSSDSDSLLISGVNTAGKKVNYLLDSSSLNESFEDISSQVKNLRQQWTEDLKIKEESVLANLGEEAEKLTNTAEIIIISPDEKRVLIITNSGKPVVYDSAPSLVPGSKPTRFEIPTASNYIWYPSTSRHIILVNEDSISVVDSDGQNNVSIYTGEFNKKVIFPWPDGSKLVISTTLNKASSNQPNLYSIRLH